MAQQAVDIAAGKRDCRIGVVVPFVQGRPMGGQLLTDARDRGVARQRLADLLGELSDRFALRLPVGRPQRTAKEGVCCKGNVVRGVALCGEVVHLDRAAIVLLDRNRLGRFVVRVDGDHVLHRLFDVAVLIQRGRQAESNARHASSGDELHVREVPRHRRMLALALLEELGELELGLDPQCQRPGDGLSGVLRFVVEVRLPNASQARIEPEHPGQRLEHRRLAGSVRAQQEAQRHRVDHRGHGSEGLEVGQAKPREFQVAHPCR